MRPITLTLLLTACVPAPPSGSGDDTGTDTGTDTGAQSADPVPTESGWWFQEVDGMQCGGGDSTGIGYEPGADDTELVVFVAGGGACWDAFTCFGLNSTVNLEVAWGAEQLQSEVGPLAASGVFDRDGASELSDANWAYVPYCTGDLHVGRTVQSYDAAQPERLTHHAGDANMAAAVDWMAAKWPDVERVWVIGISAGGYGAQMQADRFAAAWGDPELRIFADGSPMVTPYDGRYGEWRSAWDMRFPDGCTDCASSMPAVLETQADAMPDALFALSTFTNDATIMLYFNYPLGSLAGAQDNQLTPLYERERLAAFVKDGTDHTMLGNPDAHAAMDGTNLRDWFEAWTTDETLPDAW